MLTAGGARVMLAGFRRRGDVVPLTGVPSIDLGQTRDGDFVQRIAAVGRAAMSIGGVLRKVGGPDVLIARNLEMLALARRARRALGVDVPIVYECLDVHRMMLRTDPLGAAMRAAERHLARGVDLLVTSSPAFVREYFEPYGQIGAPVELVENRHLELDGVPGERPPGERGDRPWRIGWFGALRCDRSLAILAEFAARAQGRFEVVLRGRPALTAIEDFFPRVEAAANLAFHGAYRNPEDIARIYGEVDFSWVIDFFEEGQNSKWLLPNRLYEGSRHGAVPIAVDGTETARFMQEKGVGIVLPEASAQALLDALSDMDAGRHAELGRALAANGVETWACRERDCRKLVARLGALVPGRRVAEGAMKALEGAPS